MSKVSICFFVLIFTALIVLSNYLVQFPLNTFLTYGALTYPFTFLLSGILAEHYNKHKTLQIVRFGVIGAFLPSIFLAEPRIAFASISAFFIAQQVSVYVFYWIKTKSPKIWWLRSAGSTAFSQLIDTIIFFSIAFYSTMPWQNIALLILGDYMIKFALSFTNLPLFYCFGIKLKNFIRIFAR